MVILILRLKSGILVERFVGGRLGLEDGYQRDLLVDLC